MAVGTGHSQPPIVLLNTMDAISQKYIDRRLSDVTFLPSPFFWHATKNGKMFDSGSELVYPLITAEEMTGGAYWGSQILDTAVVDSIQPANQLWRHYRQAMAVPLTDVILNNKSPVDIMTAKAQVCSASLLQKLVRALYDVSPNNTALDVDSLPDWVKSTTNTIAGINRTTAANAFWRPQANGAGAGAVLSTLVAEAMCMATQFGYDSVDLIIMDNTRFGAFKNTFLDLARWTENMQDKEAVQAGFRYNFLYNNAVVLPDRNCPAQEAYFLNTKYLYPIFHELDHFTSDPWMKPHNQRVAVSTVYLTWQLSCTAPRMHGCVTNLA